MVFESATTWTKQGDIGEARAIYEYTRLGYVVCRTLFDSAKYDLVIDNGTKLYKVQVRTSGYKTKTGGYEVSLTSTGGNTVKRTYTLRNEGDFDILFVLTSDNRCWSIPSEVFTNNKFSLVLGKEKYNEYEIKGP